MKARPSQASAAASPSLGSCSSTWTTDRRLPPAGLPEPPGAARQPRAEDCPKCQALAALLGVFNRATASPAARHRRSSPARVRSARPCQLWAHRRTQLRIPSSRSRLSAVATARSHTGFWVAISPSARIVASVRRAGTLHHRIASPEAGKSSAGVRRNPRNGRTTLVPSARWTSTLRGPVRILMAAASMNPGAGSFWEI
jgi:hypothetical protein